MRSSRTSSTSPRSRAARRSRSSSSRTSSPATRTRSRGSSRRPRSRWQLEQRWKKDRILTAYLNTIYFGNGAYGIERAARTYFGHSAAKLTLPQAALLAGIPEDPSLYDPVAHPRAAKRRRALVLRLMLQQRDITTAEYRPRLARADAEAAERAPLRCDGASRRTSASTSSRSSSTSSAPSACSAAAIRVNTTIDLRLQKLARAAIDKLLPSPDGPQAALVALNPSTGAVLAMYGGRSFHASQFNLAVQGERQPGSSFKPFVLATALKEGISPLSTFVSKPISIFLGNKYWYVHNFEGEYLGPIDLVKAISASDNSVFAQLTKVVGPVERRAHGARARDHEPARRRLLDRSRHAGGEPAGDGARVRHVRERRLQRQRQGVRATSRARSRRSRT